MKLCADILYWRLKEELKAVELHGAGSRSEERRVGKECRL